MTYAQNGEDRIISRYFGSLKGILLSIGENDGITLSNSRLLIEMGWKAALVEPAESAFAKLFKLYNNDSPFFKDVWLCNNAITDENGKSIFHQSGTHLGNGDVGLLSTLQSEEMKRFIGTEYVDIEVNTITVETLLQECPFKTFDFVSIDAEGLDYNIMKQMDFDKMKTRCICVEFNGLNQHLYDGIAFNFGFRLLTKNAENLLYVR